VAAVVDKKRERLEHALQVLEAKRSGRRENDGMPAIVKTIVVLAGVMLSVGTIVWGASALNSKAEANAREVGAVKSAQERITDRLGEIERGQARIETRQEMQTAILERLDRRIGDE